MTEKLTQQGINKGINSDASKTGSTICRAFMLSGVFSIFAATSTQPESLHTQKISPVSLNFDRFSPAFAAFEDEFLFQENKSIDTESPVPSVSGTVLAQGPSSGKTSVKDVKNPVTTRAISAGPNVTFSLALGQKGSAFSEKGRNGEHGRTSVGGGSGFYASTEASSYVSHSALASASPSPVGLPRPSGVAHSLSRSHLKESGYSSVPRFTLSINSSRALASSPTKPLGPGPDRGGPSGPPIGEMDLNGTQPVDALPDSLAHSPHLLKGNVELAGGLAFLGELVVTWLDQGVQKDEGVIRQDSARFELAVEGLRGQVLASLYDFDGNLVGEGSVDLDQLRSQDQFDPEALSIVIREVDVHLAGRIRSVYTVGTQWEDPIVDAEVALYAFEDFASTSDEQGQFHFPQWRRSDSKSLAHASKEGFRDSIFLLDSNQTADVIMLSDRYVESYFKFLVGAGFDSRLASAGLIYGAVQENGQGVGEISVEVDGYRTVYLESFVANPERGGTDSSGLFTVVGLDDGDHILRIYKGSELLETRVVVVESGKVSPLTVSIDPILKPLEFYDPISKQHPSRTSVSFFDSEETIEETRQQARQDVEAETTTPTITSTSAGGPRGTAKAKINSGSDPALMEFSHDGGLSSVALISRDLMVESLPYIENHWLKALEEKLSLSPKQGVAIGFFPDNQKINRVTVRENDPEQTLYFDRDMNFTKTPSQQTVGFVLSGLEPGLYSLVFATDEKEDWQQSDLIFIDGESIAITKQQ